MEWRDIALAISALYDLACSGDTPIEREDLAALLRLLKEATATRAAADAAALDDL
jgi:hypothetical protein